MMLTEIVRDIFRSRDASTNKRTQPIADPRPAVLNVGGHDKNIAIPAHYLGWRHLVLDIDPRGEPDIVCDARDLLSLDGEQFDAVYCSHNLEHYYKHDVRKS